MLDKRIMCLDLGGSRTGVAVSDIMGMTAQGAGKVSFAATNTTTEEITVSLAVFD